MNYRGGFLGFVSWKHDPTNEENCSNTFFFGEVVGCDLLCKAFTEVIKSDSSLFVGTCTTHQIENTCWICWLITAIKVP